MNYEGNNFNLSTVQTGREKYQTCLSSSS